MFYIGTLFEVLGDGWWSVCMLAVQVGELKYVKRGVWNIITSQNTNTTQKQHKNMYTMQPKHVHYRNNTYALQNTKHTTHDHNFAKKRAFSLRITPLVELTALSMMQVSSTCKSTEKK